MVIFFPFDTDDMGVFAEARVRSGISTSILKNYTIIPLSVRKLPPTRRIPTINKLILQADVLAIVSGTYTFMRPWALEAAVYGFTQNKPMMDITQVNIIEGWSNELVDGPSPFARVKWVIRGNMLFLYTLDTILEAIWIKRSVIPRKNVQYRIEGESGLLDEIAPRYDWALDNANKNFPRWVRKSIFLAGET